MCYLGKAERDENNVPHSEGLTPQRRYATVDTDTEREENEHSG
ncbi:hypothetical protein SEA_BARRYBEE_33 [Streptomyces phage BarryBee]|nr:hypothetical protein SEA_TAGEPHIGHTER_32 [Streptomyces phage TagePhighter]WNM66791.1 hypothetical protein SEA_BARRYBEE_33 [Streptomyces phage BarryBee]